MAYDATLPCVHCIRNGYTYVYNVNAGTPIRNLENSGDAYNGKCIIKQFGEKDAKKMYKHGTAFFDASALLTSDSYADKKVAVSDCPAKKSLCGT